MYIFSSPNSADVGAALLLIAALGQKNEQWSLLIVNILYLWAAHLER
jgi:hypothetical protein